MEPHPIRLIVADDLRRSRLTVFFRLLLSLPHLFWLGLWSVVAVVVVLVAWVAALVMGRVPGGLHRFLAAYVRYATHVLAYLFLAGNPFPGFTGAAGTYPIDLEVDEPVRQSRWTVLFRVILALPALMLASTFGGGRNTGGTMGTAGFLGWFASLVRGRMPEGLRGLLAYSLRYTAQTYAYLFLLTPRYPDADPAEPRLGLVVEHPIRLRVEDDLRRSRLTVFFRLLLYLPHGIWLALWGIAAFLAVIANWFVALVRGRPAGPLHGFLAAYLRYWMHVSAFVYLVANPFPGFTGRPGSYPVELEIEPAGRQSRWVTGFRILLVFPAFFIASALGASIAVAAILGWFYSLVLGRMSPGLRNLGAYGLRYSAQVYGYLFLLTARYPHSAPPA
ncbi:MAG: DUF4389 domain-containing protein [Gaiellaceae bacterium]